MNLSISHYDKKEKRKFFIYLLIFLLLAMGIGIVGYLSYRNRDNVEMYALISSRLWQTLGIVGMSIVVVGAGLALAWRQQRILFYRTQAAAAIALRESEERFSIVFEAANDAFHIANSEDEILEVNSRMCEMLGYSRAELLKMHIADLQAPECRQSDHVLQNETARYHSTMFEGLDLHRDGRRIPVEISIARIERPQGDLFISIVRDITERKQAEEALRDSEALYRQAIEVANAVPFRQTYNANGQDVYYDFIGEGIRKITGYGPEEFNGTLWDSLAEERFLLGDLAGFSFNEAAERVRSGVNPVWKCNHRIRARDGKIHWIFEATVELRDENGIGYGSIGMLQDITERKQVEDALKLRESYLTAIIENQPGLVWLKNVNGQFLVVNSAFALSCGKQTPEEVSGRTDFDIWPWELAEKYKADDAEVIRQKTPLHIEESIFDMGQIKWFETFKKPIFDEMGLVIGTTGFARDITERKQAEEALRDSEEHLRLAISAGRMGTWDRNFLSGQLDWSVECKAMFGLASELEMSDERFMQALHPEDRMATDLAIRESLEKQTDFDTEYRVIWPDSTIHWIAAQGHGHFNETGQAIRMTGVTFDITERKQAEEEIYQLNAELEQRVHERTVQLETTNKELEAFSYSVSHDLRAPLRGIDGWSQALLEDYHDKLDEQGRQYIDRVRSETQRMGYLIDDMLKLSRLTRAELTREQVDLSAIAQAVVEQLRQNEPLRQVSFIIQAGLTAQGDPHLLEAVLANLLGNAFKFTGNCAEAYIEFGKTESQGRQTFYIRDNGAGFDMTYSQKLFGAFQRMHTISEFPGNGVGLATVQRVVHRHGGRVWAEAEVNRGATFYFTLNEKGVQSL